MDVINAVLVKRRHIYQPWLVLESKDTEEYKRKMQGRQCLYQPRKIKDIKHKSCEAFGHGRIRERCGRNVRQQKKTVHSTIFVGNENFPQMK